MHLLNTDRAYHTPGTLHAKLNTEGTGRQSAEGAGQDPQGDERGDDTYKNPGCTK